MRMIGTIASEPAARRFGDFLVSKGIEANVEAAGGGWQVWVLDDDRLAQATQALQAFSAAPDDARFDRAAGAAQTHQAEQEQKARRLRKNFVDVRTQWARVGQGHSPITMVLIALSCLVTWQTDFGKQAELTARLYFSAIGGGAPEILHGQVWRLITPIFLHFSILHILFNMWWMWGLGAGLEQRKGSLWYLLFVLLTGCFSTTVQGLIYPFSGGMSGVVYAILGYVWMAGKFRPQERIALTTDTVVIMLGWLVLGFLGFLGNMANYAHLAGLAMGVMIGYAPTGWLRLRRLARGA